MNTYQTKLVKEHSELVDRTQALHNYVYSEASDGDDKVEYANKCVQLAAMKKYEECLRARLANAGIVFEEGNYFEHVAEINTTKELETSTCSCNCDKQKTEPHE